MQQAEIGTVRIAPYPGGYRIEEIVTPSGHYIHWPDLYGSAESAARELEKLGYKKHEITIKEESYGDSGDERC